MKLLDSPPASFQSSPWKLGIVTGLSDSTTCALGWDQLAFLNRVQTALTDQGIEVPAGSILNSNFPFLPSPKPRRRDGLLLRSSYNNMVQYLTFKSSTYQKRANPHWQRILEATEKLCLVSGSCGLELIARSIQSISNFPKVAVLALGPVADRALVRWLVDSERIHLSIVRGREDWIATRGLLRNETIVPGVKHFDYWQHKEIEKLACEWLVTNISES